jgi:hypothetical protein
MASWLVDEQLERVHNYLGRKFPRQQTNSPKPHPDGPALLFMFQGISSLSLRNVGMRETLRVRDKPEWGRVRSLDPVDYMSPYAQRGLLQPTSKPWELRAGLAFPRLSATKVVEK